jgi:hypothetical protein
MTQRGRPRAADSKQRRKEFVRLIASGEDFDKAALDARIGPVRALAILSEPEIRQIIARAA